MCIRPLTLLLLRFVNLFPVFVSNTIYWVVYGLGVLAVILIELQAVEASESRIFVLIAPLALFFPGLLLQDVLSAAMWPIFFTAWCWRGVDWLEAGPVELVLLGGAACVVLQGTHADASGDSGPVCPEAVDVDRRDGGCGRGPVCDATAGVAGVVPALPGGGGASVQLQP